jgi:hypothetical protein
VSEYDYEADYDDGGDDEGEYWEVGGEDMSFDEARGYFSAVENEAFEAQLDHAGMLIDVAENVLGRPLLEEEQVFLIKGYQTGGDEGVIEAFDSLGDPTADAQGRATLLAELLEEGDE